MHISAYEARLERVAEELMGRRKWKHFQEVHTRSHMSTENITTVKQNNLKENVEHDQIKVYDNTIQNPSTDTTEEKQNLKEQDQQATEEKENETDQHTKHHKTEHIEIKEKFVEKPTEADLSYTTNTSHNSKEKDNSSSLRLENDITHRTPTKTRSDSVKSPLPIEPIDWKPDEKCNFCINGKLLTVNEKGELVAESGPAMSETDTQRLDTDSDSEGGTTEGGSLNDSSRLNLTKLLTSRQRDFPANMTSINSVPPNLATIQSLSGQYFPNINWLQLAQQTSQQLNSNTPTTSDISAAALSPSLKDSPSPSDVTGEQPLDLSSKPSPNSSTSGDLKAVRPKSSRSTPISTGRRTYSNEDLNNAIQDILDGKLGTRKAAARYSVPRSTLRNKMYKHNVEGNRVGAPLQCDLMQRQRESDVENSDEDGEGDADSSVSGQQIVDGNQSFEDVTPAALLGKLIENNGNLNALGVATTNSKTILNVSNKLERDSSPPVAEGAEPNPLATPMVDKNILLQVLLLLSRNFSGLDDRVTLRDLLNALIVHSNANLKATDSMAHLSNDSSAESSPLNNGNAASLIAQQLMLQHCQQESQQRTSPYAPRVAASDTPGTNSPIDPNENFEDQASILKIPSYKPVAGSTNAREPSMSPSLNNNNSSTNSNLHRNGDSPQSAPSPRISTSLLAASVGAAGGNNPNISATRQSTLSVISPPLASHHSLSSADSQSPPSFSLRDVITNSIHRTMSEQANKDAQAAASMLGLSNDTERISSVTNDYKKPSISVVKNIGGTDTSRFGAAPNLLAVIGGANPHSPLHHNHQSQFHLQQQHAPHHSHHSPHHLTRQEAAALAAGKGTRPKRGKYRNYDRDSLVEAVKAVQRGEMSVHRAGSYYGVPHSTLEYKVKERHLMRPRKREPKPQPGLDSSTSGSNVASSSKSTPNIPGLNSIEKLKTNSSTGSAGLKLNNSLKTNNNSMPAFPGTGPNGTKMPIFDPATVAAQLNYPASLFWQHSPAAQLNQLHLDYNRNAAAQIAAANANVSTEILKSHMQRFSDEALRAACENTPRGSNSPSPTASAIGSQNPHSLTFKNAREIAENLYESGGTNGSSFLDGIIRKTLDRKSIDMAPHVSSNSNSAGSSGALLDQLVKKTPLPFTNSRPSDYASNPSGAAATNYGPTFLTGIKRSSSPPAFPGIKRERTTPPPPPSASSDDDEPHQQPRPDKTPLFEHNNNSKVDLHGNGRTSHGSDLESDLIPDQISHLPQNTHLHHSTKTDEFNGDSALPKIKPASSPTPPQPLTEANSTANTASGAPTSILQEKLAQIKAEQESEVNL